MGLRLEPFETVRDVMNNVLGGSTRAISRLIPFFVATVVEYMTLVFRTLSAQRLNPTSLDHPSVYAVISFLYVSSLAVLPLNPKPLSYHPLPTYQDLPSTLNWEYMIPNSGYLGPNRG